MTSVLGTRIPSTATGSRRRRAFRRPSTVLTVVLWTLVAYFVLPLVWLLLSATKDNVDLFTTFGLAPGRRFSLWTNLVMVFTTQDGVFVRWLLNTALYAGAGALGATTLATMAGYAFAHYRFPGSEALFKLILGAVMIPLTALAIPTYLLFSQWGLTNSVWAVLLPSLMSPFGVYLMRVYAADSVPVSLLEAARVDGASEGGIFVRVALRLMAPGIVTVFLFALVSIWNNYFLPLIMLNSSELFPITVGLAQQQAASAAGGGAQVLFSTVITGSAVSVVPLVIAFLFLQRYWEGGLASGSVKG